MAQIVWTGRARRDLQEIIEYISRDSKAYAQSFALQLREKVGRLEAFPESGPVISEDPERLVRQITAGNYRILYLYSKEKVAILTVVHGARNLGPSS
jgi:toxin ParE1/3/4